MVTGLLPFPFDFRVMTWSEGHPRRDSERSKIGRGKVAEEEEVEAAVVEVAVVKFAAVVVDGGGAAVDEFLDPHRAPPPSAPGLDAHHDAAPRAWQRALSTVLAG